MCVCKDSARVRFWHMEGSEIIDAMRAFSATDLFWALLHSVVPWFIPAFLESQSGPRNECCHWQPEPSWLVQFPLSPRHSCEIGCNWGYFKYKNSFPPHTKKTINISMSFSPLHLPLFKDLWAQHLLSQEVQPGSVSEWLFSGSPSVKASAFPGTKRFLKDSPGGLIPSWWQQSLVTYLSKLFLLFSCNLDPLSLLLH